LRSQGSSATAAGKYMMFGHQKVQNYAQLTTEFGN